MRLLLLFLICYTTICFGSKEPYLRKLYYESVNNKDSSDKFIQLMQNLKVDNNPLLLCYKGMSYITQSKHAVNPISKLSTFNKGKELLEKAVVRDAENIEIRFMRFCVQTNVPSILGYNHNIDSDKKIIISTWANIIDLDLKQKIKQFMLQSTNCSTIEKLTFK